MLIQITDAQDSRLSDYLHLTDAALRSRLEPEQGLFMAESTNVITRAINAGCRPRSFLMAPRWLETLTPLINRSCTQNSDIAQITTDPSGLGGNIPIFLAPEPLLQQITGFHLHRGALAAMHRPTLTPVSDLLTHARRLVILEDIVDHTNVGAIFRASAALGIDAVLVTPSCADPLYRRSVRVSMGTVFQVPWTRLPVWPELSLLRSCGFTVAALALSPDATSLDKFAASPICSASNSKVAWVLGTEGDGLKPQTLAQVDQVVQIPMSGAVDSLNVASAGAVAFWATRPR